jgi:hypothetical protein
LPRLYPRFKACADALALLGVAILIAAVPGARQAHAVGVGCALVAAPRGVLQVRAGPVRSARPILRLRSGQIVSDSRVGDEARRWWHVDSVVVRMANGRFVERNSFDGWAEARFLRMVDCP